MFLGRTHSAHRIQRGIGMKTKIKENINKPEQLEQLYRSDKKGFSKAFYEIYPDISDHALAEFWKHRLEVRDKREPAVIKRNILFLITACLIAGLLIKIPQIFGINTDVYPFYERNVALIVFFGLAVYSIFSKTMINTKQIIITLSVFILSAVYVNLLPVSSISNSIHLTYLHLPLLLWCLYGLIYVDFDLKDKAKHINYIKHNGDLAILIAIIMICGGLLTGLTLELFSTIGLRVDQFYFDYIVVWGLIAVPVVATFITRIYPDIANKIAPVIANIFSPLVLVTLLVYLISILTTGKNPYSDREFLLVFNLMLLGVMAIIVFSVSENTAKQKNRFNTITLFALSIAALIVDLVALSAIVYRLGEFGFTPNRVAVLGSNVLILGNLILMMLDLFQVNFKNKNIHLVELNLARYLPIYAGWILFVVFGFPLIFGLK